MKPGDSLNCLLFNLKQIDVHHETYNQFEFNTICFVSDLEIGKATYYDATDVYQKIQLIFEIDLIFFKNAMTVRCPVSIVLLKTLKATPMHCMPER